MTATPRQLSDELIERMLRARDGALPFGLVDEIVGIAAGTPQRRGWLAGLAAPLPRRMALLAVAMLLIAAGGVISVASGWLRLTIDPPPATYANGSVITSDGCSLLALDPVAGTQRTLHAGIAGCPFPSGYELGWAPDGSKLAYIFSFFCGGCGSQLAREAVALAGIWVLDPASEHVRQLTRCETLAECDYGDLAWSPAGERLAFTFQGAIWVADVPSGGLTRLTAEDATSFDEPTWSADGSRLAYVHQSSAGSGLYSVPAAGGVATLLVSERSGLIEDPAWSPDGAAIAFATAGGEPTLRLVAADGGALTVLARGSSVERPILPQWSPDGRLIAYLRAPTGAGDGTDAAAVAELWIVGPDGSGEQRLLRTACCISAPTWSPDGRYLTFAYVLSNASSDAGVDVIGVDDRNLRHLTTRTGSFPIAFGDQPEAPAWQPIPEVTIP